MHSTDATRRGTHLMRENRRQANNTLVSLHCPLSPDTHHLINAEALVVLSM